MNEIKRRLNEITEHIDKINKILAEKEDLQTPDEAVHDCANCYHFKGYEDFTPPCDACEDTGSLTHCPSHWEAKEEYGCHNCDNFTDNRECYNCEDTGSFAHCPSNWKAKGGGGDPPKEIRKALAEYSDKVSASDGRKYWPPSGDWDGTWKEWEWPTTEGTYYKKLERPEEELSKAGRVDRKAETSQDEESTLDNRRLNGREINTTTTTT